MTVYSMINKKSYSIKRREMSAGRDTEELQYSTRQKNECRNYTRKEMSTGRIREELHYTTRREISEKIKAYTL